ncbi:hypothetical protein FT663_04149 [Candidozyma haemuli var. vulneris]|nr:hypothetical protein FT662_04293 [[Candida] haemuloni var. vulneris]KAF3988132.1 hypothetical protein FT663_04149 [[Candida] haemuloni var. vulneris]
MLGLRNCQRGLYRPFSITKSSSVQRCRSFGIHRSLATSTSKPLKKGPPRFVKLIATATGVSAIVYGIDEYYYSSLLQRSARAVYVLLWVAYQYGANVKSYDKIEDLHEEASEKLLQMLSANKGLYIKLGQAIANNGTVFPLAYQKRFINLYDAAPEDSWSSIDRTLRRQLGENYEKDIFEHFDHKPMASASIAQVHKARLKKEQQDVAVKVQHPYISKQINVDLAIYRGMSWVYSKLFDLPLTFFTSYVSDQLVKESDFRHESANAAKLSELLSNDRQMDKLNIYVPKNYDDYTRRPILVTEWIDGVSLADKQKLIDAKLNITTMMTQYVNAFGRQVFNYGFCHSDPHPGNLLARIHNGKQELVILDHGLYVTLPEKFRKEYCAIWESLFSYDTQRMEEIANSWGIGDASILTTMVQLRPPPKDFIKKNSSSYDIIKSFLGDETKFPLQMLFLSRSMRMMQNLNQTMGSPVNRINMFTNCALQTLTEERKFSLIHPGPWVSLLRVKFSLFLSNLVFLFFRLKQLVTGDKYGDRGEGIEDYIESYMKETAKYMGIEIA